MSPHAFWPGRRSAPDIAARSLTREELSRAPALLCASTASRAELCDQEAQRARTQSSEDQPTPGNPTAGSRRSDDETNRFNTESADVLPSPLTIVLDHIVIDGV